MNVGIEIHLGHQGDRCPHPGEWAYTKNREDDDEGWSDEEALDIPPAEENLDGAPSPNALTPDLCAPALPTDISKQVVNVVDISGVHKIVIRPCRCGNNINSDDVQLLQMRLFPSTFKVIKTVFTLRVLDDFRIDNLVCNTTAYQYYKKIRRITSPAFPHTVPVRVISTLAKRAN